MLSNTNEAFVSKKHFSGSKIILIAQPQERILDLIRQTTGDLCNRHGLKGRPRPDDVLHVSIAGFDPSSITEDELCHLLSRLEFDEFDIYFDRAASFQGSDGKPLVLHSDNGNQALVELEGSVSKLLEPRFGKPHRQAYNPHMTLLYDKGKIVPHKIEVPVQWRVRELLLVESLQGQTKYRLICKFPCRRLH